MTLGKLREQLKKLEHMSDATPVLTPGGDHSYREPNFGVFETYVEDWGCAPTRYTHHDYDEKRDGNMHRVHVGAELIKAVIIG